MFNDKVGVVDFAKRSRSGKVLKIGRKNHYLEILP
jgi:hypothetical protein